jgi:L-seryl-tRNA(Ser) seleniumtransferase
MTPRDDPRIAQRLRAIRPINQWLSDPLVTNLAETFGREQVLSELRRLLDFLRERVIAGDELDVETCVARELPARLAGESPPGLRRVINATGILLHTGLGRAPLSKKAVEAICATASGYCNLEFDLATGTRGRRADLIRDALRRVTGAPAATVVNNNAAATILALRALAAGKEVIVSRGQLVEIGGGFRLPEIMAVSGAKLREVGTTNRTRLGDFEAAIGPETAMILRVHTSNYAVIGFTEEPEAKALADLAHQHGLAFVDDIGSGALTADAVPTRRQDPNVADSLKIGADLVLFSGDKLLGGPQCGILVGTSEAVGRVEKDPLMRAFRVDKLTLAALAATLESWADRDLCDREIPFWRMLRSPIESLRQRAAALAEELCQNGWNATVEPSLAYAGGGSLPSETIESQSVVLRSPWPLGISSEADMASRLRLATPAVVGRLHDGGLWLDMRSVSPQEDETLLSVILSVSSGGFGP